MRFCAKFLLVSMTTLHELPSDAALTPAVVGATLDATVDVTRFDFAAGVDPAAPAAADVALKSVMLVLSLSRPMTMELVTFLTPTFDSGVFVAASVGFVAFCRTERRSFVSSVVPVAVAGFVVDADAPPLGFGVADRLLVSALAFNLEINDF